MRSLFTGAVLLVVPACGYLEDATTVPVDFDVEVIEPVEFDGSQAVPAAAVDVSVSAASPTVTIPITNADRWGALLQANKMAEDEGDPRIFTIRSTQAPVFTATAPVQFVVDVSSATGTVFGATVLTDDPGAPTACTFSLDPATAQADDFGIALEGCLSAWVEVNGVPGELAMSVTATSLATAAGPGGDDFSYSSFNTMSTDSEIEADCELEITLPDSVTDRVNDISSFDPLGVSAFALANEQVTTSWFAFVFDSAGNRVAAASGYEPLGAGEQVEYHASIDDGTVTQSGDANVNLAPADPGDFLTNVIDGLSGRTTGAPGSAMACWFSFGTAPRSGQLSVIVDGVANAGL